LSFDDRCAANGANIFDMVK